MSHFVLCSAGEDGSPRLLPVHSEGVAAGCNAKDTAHCDECGSLSRRPVGDET